MKTESSEDIANECVFGKEQLEISEKNSDWVKSVMHRLESRFESGTVKRMDGTVNVVTEWMKAFALVRELKSTAAGIEEFTNSGEGEGGRSFL